MAAPFGDRPPADPDMPPSPERPGWIEPVGDGNSGPGGPMRRADEPPTPPRPKP